MSSAYSDTGPSAPSRTVLMAQVNRARDELTIALQRLHNGPNSDVAAAEKAIARARAALGSG
jgi:hypothetical protein